jgi:hypothetical protein
MQRTRKALLCRQHDLWQGRIQLRAAPSGDHGRGQIDGKPGTELRQCKVGAQAFSGRELSCVDQRLSIGTAPAKQPAQRRLAVIDGDGRNGAFVIGNVALLLDAMLSRERIVARERAPDPFFRPL